MVTNEANSSKILEWVLTHGVGIVLAIGILIAGWIIINFVVRTIRKTLKKKELDRSLEDFLCSLLKVLLRILLLLSVAGMVGFQTTSFIAVLGAASLAIGLALQGTLQNFAGGVIILMLKPFKTGDFIDVSGSMGTVQSISIFYTYLKTPDNRIVLLPNGSISNTKLVNFTREETRRVDMTIGISYGDDVKLARNMILEMLESDDRVLKEPAPMIALASLGDNSVDLTVRFWAPLEHYWPLFFQLQEKIYEEFPKAGINFPFPQLDVHMQS